MDILLVTDQLRAYVHGSHDLPLDQQTARARTRRMSVAYVGMRAFPHKSA